MIVSLFISLFLEGKTLPCFYRLFNSKHRESLPLNPMVGFWETMSKISQLFETGKTSHQGSGSSQPLSLEEPGRSIKGLWWKVSVLNTEHSIYLLTLLSKLWRTQGTKLLVNQQYMCFMVYALRIIVLRPQMQFISGVV